VRDESAVEQGRTTYEVGVSRDGVRGVITIRGEVDDAARAALWSALDEVTAMECTTVVFDLGHVAFMDSAGLNLFVRAGRRFGLDNVVLRSPTRSVTAVLRLSGLDRVLRVEDPS
jgi:anti-anti-sigma factor